MKMYAEVEVELDVFLTSAMDWGEWPAGHSSHFTPRERAPSTHWLEEWVGSRASLDTVAKRKIPSPYQEPPLSSL